MRILVIEDEPRMLELLRRGLQEHDFTVMTALDGEIVLDIGLPRRDGFEVVRVLRERCCTMRVLILTARDAEDDVIRGLETGADDYLTKPFSFPELVARLQSITRQPRREEVSRIEAGDLAVDPVRRAVTRGDNSIDLTRSEFSLLLSLARSAGRCVSRRSLMESVWGASPEVGAGALDVLVNSLRSKLDASDQPKLIHTVRGSGYLLSNSWPTPESARP